MIRRELTAKIKFLYKKFPVLFLTGPRQSGKTTLLKNEFPKLPYATLEDPDTLSLSQNDPRAFLNSFKKGGILDEAQRSPQLFSYIQGIVDNDKSKRFVLSGSQNFLLSKQISQSLAGRTGVLTLLPLSAGELNAAQIKTKPWNELALKGFYPRVYADKIPVQDFYSSYIRTYVERDVRLTLNIGDLKSFNSFLKLCAGRAGQILNLSSLAQDAGISVNTAKAWISVLESSYIIFLLQPHFNNYNKRLIKSPKLYFYDTGLLCNLLSLQKPQDVLQHYMKGAIFENLVIAELLKTRYNQGKETNIYYWRDKTGNEVDCLLQRTASVIEAIEIKAGETFNSDYFNGLKYWSKSSGHKAKNCHLVYAGKKELLLEAGYLHAWENLKDITQLAK